MVKWIKLKKYCQISGDTTNAVHGKRKRGMWLDGLHCKVGPDGNLWVNLEEVEKWVELGDQGTLQRLQRV
ncbi:TPA: excisionase [Legionella pneumophila]|nr:excisionase [Legionella pneumophila]